MDIKIALAGNPNSGKTTLFNALTGMNQYVGNWPGVTVEKKEGKLKKHEGVIVTDLPGIYSLSPYTLEEVVARNYLIDEKPNVILNIVDGTNFERNLYLTSQLSEIGIPIVIAINMMDVVAKSGDKIDKEELSRQLGCKVVEISALKGEGINEAAEVAISEAKNARRIPTHIFSGPVEHALAHIEEAVCHDMPEEKQRWYAVKIFERDSKVLEKIKVPKDKLEHIENDIKAAEAELGDDSESIIITERYDHIEKIIKSCYKKKAINASVSDKIDKVVTHKIFGLPIFALIMFLVYLIAMAGPGAWATNWANDGLFGDGFYLFGIGRGRYEEAVDEYTDATYALRAYGIEYDTEEGLDADEVLSKAKSITKDENNPYKTIDVEDEETLEITNKKVYFDVIPRGAGEDDTIMITFAEAIEYFEEDNKDFSEPDVYEYGPWVRSIPDLVSSGLDNINAPRWLHGLIVNGILTGVGAVLGFVPQMIVLFLLLAILEACGYMSRIAFVLDKLFRKFGLSGKSFIPILVGTGCGVPGIMASRTIENESDRRMTIMTTTFIPCGAKVPFIAMIAGALFGKSPLIATGAYFIGIAAIIVSGIILKKTRVFASNPSPFVMELPPYHAPTIKNTLRTTWDRSWSFIKKAGTVILISSVIIWFLSNFGFKDGFQMLEREDVEYSILARIGKLFSWIFIPLGWGNWQATVASATGIAAKENIVGTMSVLYGSGNLTTWQVLAQVFNKVTGFSFLVFNLLCAPCVAAIGAIKREMNSIKWTLFAIGYQCTFAYIIALIINQIGQAISGTPSIAGLIISGLFILMFIYLLFIKKQYRAKKGINGVKNV